MNWCSGISRDLPMLAPPGDIGSPQLILLARFRTNTDLCNPLEDEPTVACYTDGSKLESGRTGAGVHFPGWKINDLVIYLGYYASVFQAEVLAITLAAVRRLSNIRLLRPLG